MTRAVIFDLDGVLVDSEPLSLGVLADEMRALGIADATPEEVGRQFLGVSLKVIRAYHYSCILLSALNQCATMTKLGIMDGGVVGRRDAGALGFLTP